jgi:hypothetical protein
MTGCGCIDQNIGVEGVHVGGSAAGSTGRHVGDELLGPLGAHDRRISEMGVSTSIEKPPKALGFREGLVCPPDPNRVWTDEDRDLAPMACDRDFLARDHTVEDLWQRGSGFAHGHR